MSAYHRKCKINSKGGHPPTETIKETDLHCTEGHYLDELTPEQFDKISVKLHNRITPEHNRITNNTRVPKCRTELKKGNGPCKIHVFWVHPSFAQGI